MPRQAEYFLEEGGDLWHERNKDKPRLPDPVLDAMEACKLQPTAVLELGCGNGWRLAEIKHKWPICECKGYDASEKAILEHAFPEVWIGAAEIMNALKQQIRPAAYDLVIFGFCLYLVDREDLMMIAAHTDRILKDDGHIIIHDFGQPIEGQFPFRIAYKHKEGIWSYHMNYCDLWTGNPAYKLIYGKTVDVNNVAVDVLKKDMNAAWPVREP